MDDIDRFILGTYTPKQWQARLDEAFLVVAFEALMAGEPSGQDEPIEQDEDFKYAHEFCAQAKLEGYRPSREAIAEVLEKANEILRMIQAVSPSLQLYSADDVASIF